MAGRRDWLLCAVGVAVERWSRRGYSVERAVGLPLPGDLCGNGMDGACRMWHASGQACSLSEWICSPVRKTGNRVPRSQGRNVPDTSEGKPERVLNGERECEGLQEGRPVLGERRSLQGLGREGL